MIDRWRTRASAITPWITAYFIFIKFKGAIEWTVLKEIPNTAKTKQAAPVEKNVTPITSQVTVKKETEVKKFARQFISEDAKSVKGHIL